MRLTAYHGSPKPFESFTEYRKRPNEAGQLHFGFHFALSIDDARRYGRFVAICDIEYHKVFDMDVTAAPDKLPPGHLEVVEEVLARSRNRHILDWVIRDKMIYTGAIQRASNKLIRDVLLKHGFDLVNYTAEEWVMVDPRHKKDIRYPAVIAMHASQIRIREWDVMTKEEWDNWNEEVLMQDWSAMSGEDEYADEE